MKKLIIISSIALFFQSCWPSSCDCAKMTREGYVGSSDFNRELSNWNDCREEFGNDWRVVSRKKCDD